MDDYVNNMVTFEIIFVKVIIQGKTDVADGSVFRGLFTKSCFQDVFKIQLRQVDVRIFLYSGQIIKNKWTIKSVGIDRKAQGCEKKKYCEEF